MSMPTSISNKAIRIQFRTQLLRVEGIPGPTNQAWENRGFEPTTGEPWIRETIMKGDERLVANNEIEAVGVCQIDYFVPVGSSIYDAEDVADAIKKTFRPTMVLGGLVRIERSRVLTGGRGVSGYQSESGSSPWYQLPVHIDFVTFSLNE